MAAAADLVRAHHGHLDLESTPGRGSTFTVTVPLLVATSHGEPNEATPRSQQPPSLVAQPTVLLVEDDTDLREFLTRLLTGDGWLVQAVADAETALEKTGGSSDGPHVVVTM